MTNANDPVFLVGPYLDTTRFQGQKTLYVTGVRNPAMTIEYARENGCKHVFLGYNNSFQRNKFLLGLIEELLTCGFNVTVEFPFQSLDWCQENFKKEWVDSNNFLPLVNVMLPNISVLGGNYHIKISDDTRSNVGEWTMPVSELCDSNRLLVWDEIPIPDVHLTEDENKKEINRRNQQRILEEKRNANQ